MGATFISSIKPIITSDRFHLFASVLHLLITIMAKNAGFKCGVVSGSVIAENVNVLPDYG